MIRMVWLKWPDHLKCAAEWLTTVIHVLLHPWSKVCGTALNFVNCMCKLKANEIQYRTTTLECQRYAQKVKVRFSSAWTLGMGTDKEHSY